MGGPDEDEAFSLRTPSWALGDVGLAALVPLLRARTTADVVGALAGWVEPVNNLLVADVHGDVRQQVVGRVPRRSEENRWRPVPGHDPLHAWTGWVDPLPGRAVAPEEQLATANHRLEPDFDRIGVEFAPPGRARRIDTLLAGRSDLTLEDFAEVHRDVLAGQPAALVAAIAELRGLDQSAADLQARIGAWDQRFAADSTVAAEYVAVRETFVDRLAEAPAFAPLSAGPGPYGPLLAAWFDPRLQLYLSLATLLSDRGRGLVPDLDARLVAAVEEVARGADRGPWGERHRFRPFHALGLAADQEPALAGDNDCVRCTGGLPGSDAAVRGSVARYVWDLGGTADSGWAVPLGAHGDPGHPHHHDQRQRWIDGDLLPLVTSVPESATRPTHPH